MTYTNVSLFTGAMGLDLGLERAGLQAIFANEVDTAACGTIASNRPDLPLSNSSVEALTADEIRRACGVEFIDVVSGGPPCQAFSTFGRRRGTNDRRGAMVYEFLRVVEVLRPVVFVMENVRGLHSMAASEPEYSMKGGLLQKIIDLSEAAGYRIDGYLVNAASYGAPQNRERLFLIGNRHGLRARFPQASHGPGLAAYRTLKDAIGHLPPAEPEEVMNFSPRKLRYLSLVPSGGNWRDLPDDIAREAMGKAWTIKGGRSGMWRRLSWEVPSPTLVAMPNHYSTSMCHPDLTRALSIREYAAIQEFPEDWVFAGTLADQYRQIGNAVPLRLAKVVGDVIVDLLDRISGREQPSGCCHSEVRSMGSMLRLQRYVAARSR